MIKMCGKKETYVKPHKRRNSKNPGKHNVKGHTRRTSKQKTKRGGARIDMMHKFDTGEKCPYAGKSFIINDNNWVAQWGYIPIFKKEYLRSHEGLNDGFSIKLGMNKKRDNLPDELLEEYKGEYSEVGSRSVKDERVIRGHIKSTGFREVNGDRKYGLEIDLDDGGTYYMHRSRPSFSQSAVMGFILNKFAHEKDDEWFEFMGDKR